MSLKENITKKLKSFEIFKEINNISIISKAPKSRTLYLIIISIHQYH